MFGTLFESAVPMAADDSESDRSSPKTFVNYSAVTTNIKIKLAAQHLTRIVRKLNLAIGDGGLRERGRRQAHQLGVCGRKSWCSVNTRRQSDLTLPRRAS
jgi:hypothetical protein